MAIRLSAETRNLFVLRARVGLTQEEFGALFGRKKAQICKIENGVNLPSAELFAAIAAHFAKELNEMGVEANWLLRPIEGRGPGRFFPRTKPTTARDRKRGERTLRRSARAALDAASDTSTAA